MSTPKNRLIVNRRVTQYVALALLLTLVVSVAYKYSQGQPSDITELLKATLWPIFATVALFVLRKPVIGFLDEMSRRGGKMSVFNIELELREAQAKPVLLAAVNELKRGQAITVGDSSTTIFTQLRGQASGDYILVDLGRGEEWITSRLFIVAALFPRMRGVRCIVFVNESAGRPGQFVGTALVDTVRWRLAQAFPWLEVALLDAMHTVIPGPAAYHPTGQPAVVNSGGALETTQAASIAQYFISNLQQAGPGPTLEEWVQIATVTPMWERASWVSTQTLQELLGPDLNRASVSDIGRTSTEDTVRAIVSRSGAYVAGVTDGAFTELIDRTAILEELAKRLPRSAT